MLQGDGSSFIDHAIDYSRANSPLGRSMSAEDVAGQLMRPPDVGFRFWWFRRAEALRCGGPEMLWKPNRN